MIFGQECAGDQQQLGPYLHLFSKIVHFFLDKAYSMWYYQVQSEERDYWSSKHGLGDSPTESLFWKDTTMKKNLSNTAKPVKHKWAKVIATVEKHAAKKTLRYVHKVELKNFEFDEVFT